MAKASWNLIGALERTAEKLENGAPYQWGHMGQCNCGNLAQELTSLSPSQIHNYAMESRKGDWEEQVSAFCNEGEMHIDLVISSMIEAGLSQQDIISLERLSDKQILNRIPEKIRSQIRHNDRSHVAAYMREWASMLKEEVELV
jgi:hypothetical protein